MNTFIIIIVILAIIVAILNIGAAINGAKAMRKLIELQEELDKSSDELKKKLLKYSVTLKNENKNI